MEHSATVEAATDNPAAVPGIEELARAFRAAVIAGDHERAAQLLPRYGDAVRALWESLPKEQRAVSSLPRKAQELMSWAQQATLIQRNLTADHLALLQKASRYQSSLVPHTLEVKA